MSQKSTSRYLSKKNENLSFTQKSVHECLYNLTHPHSTGPDRGAWRLLCMESAKSQTQQSAHAHTHTHTHTHNSAKGLREPNVSLGNSIRHQVYLNYPIIWVHFAWSMSKKSLQFGEALEVVQMRSRAPRWKEHILGQSRGSWKSPWRILGLGTKDNLQSSYSMFTSFLQPRRLAMTYSQTRLRI